MPRDSLGAQGGKGIQGKGISALQQPGYQRLVNMRIKKFADVSVAERYTLLRRSDGRD